MDIKDNGFNNDLLFGLQYFEDENMEQVQIGRLLPPPRINLCFENGRISYWNSR